MQILAKLEEVCYTIFMVRLEKFIHKNICVATSGGVDSMSLLHYLQTQQAKYGYLLSAVHCEHGIRGEESVSDWKFVEQTCKALGIPLYFFAEDCPMRAEKEKVSLETAARNFRYESFFKLIEDKKVDYIATAHHLDDEAETVLFRLCRGTSLSGVKGIAEENGCLLRPFLDWTREEIERYAKQNKIEYRIDSTNLERDATRNVLRLDVLPRLEKAVAGASKNLVRFAKQAGEDDALLYEYAESLLSYTLEGESEQIQVSFCDKKPIFRRACLMAMKYLGVEKDYTFTHLESLYFLQRLEGGACVHLPKNIQAKKMSAGIVFFEKTEEFFEKKKEPKKFTEKGFDGGRYEVKCSFAPLKEENLFKILRVDMEKIPPTAIFRFRQEGDEMERFGGGRKTLKKIFNEEKIPKEEREYFPLIAEKKGEVYAVCGVEISEKVKITGETKKVLYIALRKKGEKQ